MSEYKGEVTMEKNKSTVVGLTIMMALLAVVACVVYLVFSLL